MKRSGAVRRRRDPVEKRLTALCRRLVVEIRDHDTCQRCGARRCDSQIHWAHVKAGRAKSLTWQPWASLALCAGCHFWYDGNGNGKPGTESRLWWASKWPDRDFCLQAWERERRRPKFDAALTLAWLEREIERTEAP